jgi:hypothetical protein
VSWSVAENKDEESEEEESLWGDPKDPSSVGLNPHEIVKLDIVLDRANKYGRNRPAFSKTSRSVEAGFWLILADLENNKVLAIKRIASLKRRL